MWLETINFPHRYRLSITYSKVKSNFYLDCGPDWITLLSMYYNLMSADPPTPPLKAIFRLNRDIDYLVLLNNSELQIYGPLLNKTKGNMRGHIRYFTFEFYWDFPFWQNYANFFPSVKGSRKWNFITKILPDLTYDMWLRFTSGVQWIAKNRNLWF